MRAITLKQPWAYAIAYEGKDIENRTWAPPARLIGKRIAIHAGKGLDRLAPKWLLDNHRRSEQVSGAIIATVEISHVVNDHASPWFMGPIGWVLQGMQLVDPVYCRGRLGLWTMRSTVGNCVPSPQAH